MLITIDQPDGPRLGAQPADGIRDDFTLVRSLLVTLASERIVGHRHVTLTIDLEGADPGNLVGLAKRLKGIEPRQTSTSTGPAGGAAVVCSIAGATGRGKSLP